MTEEITHKLVNVTPDIAQRWLNQNTHNRRLYESVIESYALDMKRGKWVLNHQGICFNNEGVLDDGQHRLHAIIRSGCTIPMYVFRNMPRVQGSNGDLIVTQDTIDDIKKRSVGDKLHLSYGMENANIKVAMTSIIVMICNGSARKLSPAIVKDIYEMYKPEIEVVVENRGNVKGLMVAPVMGAFVFAAACFKDKAINFEKSYFSGENLTKNSPILVFRNYMLNRTYTAGKEYGRSVIASHALNCLMHYVLENQLKRLIQTRQGVDFFIGKQKRAHTELIELLKL